MEEGQWKGDRHQEKQKHDDASWGLGTREVQTSEDVGSIQGRDEEWAQNDTSEENGGIQKETKTKRRVASQEKGERNREERYEKNQREAEELLEQGDKV